MRLVALVVVCLATAALPARAQDRPAPDPQDIVAAFERLLGTPDSRAFFGLPPDRFWRPQRSVSLSLDPGAVGGIVPISREVAKLLSGATGRNINIYEVDRSRPRYIVRLASTEIFWLTIGERRALAEEAFTKNANRAALERFETGTWPFVFVIPDRTMEPPRDGRAVVYLADDEPMRALEASIWLIAFWALGGVTLGPELEGLVDPEAGGPALTTLGEAVLGLFFDPRLEPGMPIPEVMAQARQIMDD